MKKLFYTFIATTSLVTERTFAQENFLGMSNSDLRSGDLNIHDVPIVLATVINTIIALAGTISIVMLIYFAVQMQVNSGISGDASGVDRAKKGMIAAGIGFIISVSAWFVVGNAIKLLDIVSQ